ncbi:ABC transporter permease subunit [Orbus hercynius]|uniref:ABC transporter permease subunit n=1 Tax=Orbus hercynius TaxID=593135 RepID=UPI001475A9C4|nr:ABC transporter permease subunit [Orbus hercynius]
MLVLLLLSLISVVIIYFAPNSPFNNLSFFEVYQVFYQQIFFNEFVISNKSLWEIFTQILLPTFELSILAIIGSIIVGFPIGIFAGLTKSNKINHFIKLVCLVLYACPIIWLTILVMFVLSTDWLFIKNPQYEPSVRSLSLLHILLTPHEDKLGLLLTEMKYLFVPVMILTIQPCIITIQLISQRVSITARQNYIKVASIRENSSRKVLFRHLLPNAVPTAIPQLAYNITTLLFSTMTIEILLNRSGLGTWVFSAFHQQDYVVIALAIFSCGALVSLLTLLSEIFVVAIYPMQSRTLYE